MNTVCAERRPRRYRGVAGLVAAAAIGCACPQPLPAASPPAVPTELERLSQAFRTAYQRAYPAVVLVTAGRRQQAGEAEAPYPRPQPLEPGDEDREEGLGSGILASSDGYVVTSHHVVAGADSIQVTLADSRAFLAALVGTDSLVDIAVLKIPVTGAPFLKLARSRDLRVGDWVLALGHPLGMGPTLTHGIVGALGRQADLIGDDYGIESFIQTDAPINPGSSGGPLLDLRGQVVGVSTAISTRTGYYMGYGLAVPADLVREAMDDILAYGRVRRGYLGIGMSAVTHETVRARGLQLAAPRGVLLTVAAGSPAARGGLQDGDVMLQIAGQPVVQPNQVQAIVYQLEPGQMVAVQVLRANRRLDFRIVLGEREDDRLLAAGRERLEQLGLTIDLLPDGAASAVGAGSRGGRPVQITAVVPCSPADARGLVAGDVITEIDAQTVASVDGVLRQLATADGGQAVVFWLWRPGQGVDVRVVPPPE